MTGGLDERPDLAGAGHGGVAARRAVIRWAWRLFRREWRQQVLVVALLAVAVAATILGVAVAASTPSSPTAAFGTASAQLTVPGADPHLAADIAAIRQRFGVVDVIENARLAGTGTVQPVELRAQDPHGRYGQPMLSLVSGRYPARPGQAAVTGGVACGRQDMAGDRPGGEPSEPAGSVRAGGPGAGHRPGPGDGAVRRQPG